MNLQHCIKFANENPVCSLATVENDQPRVRIVGLWFADETGFYFQTGAIKEFYKQLVKNPKTEVGFYNNENKNCSVLRISGSVEFVNDLQLKEKVLEDRPFLKEFGLTADSPRLVIFRITHGQANLWTMENNLKPKDVINF